jgi:hypothetical protein
MSSRATFVSFAVVLFACAAHHKAADDDTSALAQDGADTNAAENDAETMTTSLVAPAGTSLGLASAGDLGGGSLHVNDIGDVVRASYLPAGCATVTNDTVLQVAVYVFNGCTGPYGLVNVSGTVKVRYATPALNRLVLDFTANDLHVNKATVDWSAHAEIVAGLRGRRDMTWSAQLSGTTGRGKTLSRRNKRQVSWMVGGECVTVNGSSDGQVGGRGVHTDIIGEGSAPRPAARSGSRTPTTENRSTSRTTAAPRRPTPPRTAARRRSCSSADRKTEGTEEKKT